MLGKKVKTGQNQLSTSAINLPIPPGPSTWQVRPGWYVTCYSVTFEIPVRSFDMAWMMMCWHSMGFAMVFFHGGFAFVIWFDLIWAKPAHIKKGEKNYDQLDTFVQSQSNMFNQIKQTGALLILKNKTWLLLKAFINLSNQSPPQENLPFTHLKWSSSCCRICAKSILHLLQAQHNLVKLTWTSVSNEHLNNKDLTYLSLFVMLAWLKSVCNKNYLSSTQHLRTS